MEIFKPSKNQLIDAYGKPIPDIIAPDLKVLFCGINPGLYSGATGKHFARPGNKFWRALHQGGFITRQLSPFEGEKLLEVGYGITNLVNKTTAGADELTKEEFLIGSKELGEKTKKFKPKVLAVLGLGAFRIGFNQPKAKLGLQDYKVAQTYIWVLPNPSGLNAHFQSADFAKLFQELLDFTSKGQ